MEGFNLDLDFGVNLDKLVDFGSPLVSTSGSDLPSTEPSEDAAASPNTNANQTNISTAQGQRRYLAKRPHRKSRTGCKQCKKRKVKCDEAKPICKSCSLRKEECIYPATSQQSLGASLTTTSTGVSSAARAREQSVDDDFGPMDNEISFISEPLFLPEQTADAVDMKMLWFYTTYSFNSLSINSGRSPEMNHALKIKVVEHAFRSPFLMESLKALSALHLRKLNQIVPTHKVISYQARAFEGYRSAIESANPKDFPALLACSLVVVALSSQTFRDPNGKRLFVVDWIALLRGIGLIVELIKPQAVADSGLAPLFYRPPIDMNKATHYIPNNLLSMVTSIKYDDADFEYQNDYYELVQHLGALYMELVEHGFGPVLDLRVITYFTFCPILLLPLAKQHRPRILIIIAYWLCFVKLTGGPPWWMQGLMPQMNQIIDEVGEEWWHLLHIPRMIMETDDKIRSARLLIDNDDWVPSELDLYHENLDPRTKTDLKFVNNDGAELEIVEGHWQFKTTGAIWEEPQRLRQEADLDFSNQELLLGTDLLHNIPHRISTISAVSPATSTTTSSTAGSSPLGSSSKSPAP